MRYSIALFAGIVASATAIPTEPARTVETVANELACVARVDMACAGVRSHPIITLVSKRSETELANELACVARGDMACAGLVAKRDPEMEQLANELACVARGDMACAGLVSKKRAIDEAVNELACVARGDMACAGLVSKRADADAVNELACVARGDMACAGLVAKKRATTDVVNELACVARGDMACAGYMSSTCSLGLGLIDCKFGSGGCGYSGVREHGLVELAANYEINLVRVLIESLKLCNHL
ncbi:hypothetical protein LZ32DRAFT_623306 [Colletotrichum eremochloae]|nr:hypothetical protein LZ32DRAFT_623306 [Colletotrichum eremochloae]